MSNFRLISFYNIGAEGQNRTADSFHLDLLPVGGHMFAVYQNPRLLKGLLWAKDFDIGAFAACDSSLADYESCSR